MSAYLCSASVTNIETCTYIVKVNVYTVIVAIQLGRNNNIIFL